MMVFELVLIVALQQPPVPQPFPKPGTNPQAPPSRTAPLPTPTPTPAPPKPGQAEAAPTEAFLGVPIYPGAQFIASYDAGRGQRYYIFGSPAPFVDLVTYYRTVLKQKGELVYEVPATHEFDVGGTAKTMAFPPGVTIASSRSLSGYPSRNRAASRRGSSRSLQFVPVVESERNERVVGPRARHRRDCVPPA
jgi:hypothetical protein